MTECILCMLHVPIYSNNNSAIPIFPIEVEYWPIYSKRIHIHSRRLWLPTKQILSSI